jgi:hypothetical protein
MQEYVEWFMEQKVKRWRLKVNNREELASVTKEAKE